jgi:streptomycin 6-kinase
MPRRLVEQAVSLAASLLSDEASTGRMIHGDLHYENVLAADREPWLVIDPKPMSGDPHYEVAPLLWNRWDEVVASGRVREAVRRRFHAVVDAAGLDEERARDWVVVRALHNAFWSVDDARSLGHGLDGRDREWITTMVTVAKAVQG